MLRFLTSYSGNWLTIVILALMTAKRNVHTLILSGPITYRYNAPLVLPTVSHAWLCDKKYFWYSLEATTD